MTSMAPKGPSTASLQRTGVDQITRLETPTEHDAHVEDAASLKPFVRPPFPEKVRDRSVVSGLSSDTVLRTCFRIGEMINQATRCLNDHQEVVFELFARVTYSNRESLERKQHFQFIDLFKDQYPYPAGVFTNWRAGSQVDQQSAAFLGLKDNPKMCWCMCKPVRDRKSPIRLTLVIMTIRETDWAHIEWAKRVVCGASS
ncbi:hypothetical protein F4677DRAFT_257695 [Hypoxylon crocopeplum]|nr:hypothetical protein F4677DRAFT_257695 [Hypoxylon crocopeplum]